MAAIVHIGAFKRVPFVDDIVFIGPNWSSATFLMHIRHEKGDTGTPLVSLGNATAGTQGISCTFNPSYIWVNENGVTQINEASSILINISEATIDALSLANPYYEPLKLKYDIHVTPSGGVKSVEVEGDFIVYPGVTV